MHGQTSPEEKETASHRDSARVCVCRAVLESASVGVFIVCKWLYSEFTQTLPMYVCVFIKYLFCLFVFLRTHVGDIYIRIYRHEVSY